MTFTVTYRGKDGSLHEEVLEAANRTVCVATCRARGIVPTTIHEGRGGTGRVVNVSASSRGGLPWKAALLAASALVVVCCAWWFLATRKSDGQGHSESQVKSVPQKPAQPLPKDEPPNAIVEGTNSATTFVVPELPTVGNAKSGKKENAAKPAEPEARGQLRGTEARIERAKARGDRRIFVHDSECYLSNFAIPGEQVPPTPFEKDMVEDLMKALDEPITVDMNEDSETDIQMKNIVQGMKQEIKEYLKGGGTIETYLAELQKRQDREASYYSEAFAMVNKSAKEDDPAMAYELWKKTNEHLQKQGIRTMPLPRRLWKYERNL